MSNYAALVDVLSIAGSRLSDGTPNSSGTVYFFRPGTNTPVNVYSDAEATTIITQPVTLNSGGLINLADFPNGIYVTQPVRVLVQDVSANTVVDTTYIPATAGDVGVNNAGFTDSNLDDVLTKAFTSFGGQDWTYKESGGATSRTVKSKFAEVQISVKDFGAVGDGVHVDTTNIQDAINRVKALGGGVCYFPPGTYLVDQALTLSSSTGVSIVGSGSGSTVLRCNNGAANGFTITSPVSLRISDLTLTHTGTSSGTAIAITSGSTMRLTNVGVTGGDWLIGASVTGSLVFFDNCSIGGQSANAAARGIVSSATFAWFRGGSVSATLGAGIEFKDPAADTVVDGVGFTSTTVASGILFNSNVTGTRFSIFGCTRLGTVGIPIDIGTATIPVYRQWGNGIEASATSSATGAAQTPVLYTGNEIILTAASGGAGTVTVNAPAILPGTAATDVDLFWDFIFKNAAGGAVTWSLNAVFVVATAVPTTDGHTIAVRFRWDRTTSKLREASRADTVT